MSVGWRGALIGVWGAAAYLLTLGLFADPWIMIANCVLWAIVYMRRPLTLGIFGVQVGVTLAAAVAATLAAEWSLYALLAVFPALFYCALWMAPVAMVRSYMRGSTPAADKKH